MEFILEVHYKSTNISETHKWKQTPLQITQKEHKTKPFKNLSISIKDEFHITSITFIKQFP